MQVIEHCGMDIGEDPLTRTIVCRVLGYCPNTRVVAQKAEISNIGKEYTLVTAFIYESDPNLHGNMARGLKNASLVVRYEWPKSVTEAYKYPSKWEGEQDIVTMRGLRLELMTNPPRLVDPNLGMQR